MEVRFVGHNEIDVRKWESCVHNSLNACVFAHCWYLDTLSLNWQALVLDDYEAVMPFFVFEGTVCLRYGVAWTGVYSCKGLTPEICGMFIDRLEQRFSRIDLVFDKYFVVPDKTLRGLFFREKIYQVETMNPPEIVGNGDEFLKVLKAKYPKAYDENIRFREYTPKNIRSLDCVDFMRLNKSVGIRDAQKLKYLAEVSVSKKFGYFMEISLSDENIKGAILVTFYDNYIFVPYLRCRNMPESYGQYVMLLDMILRHFAFRPGIVVLDCARIGVGKDVYEKLGASSYTLCRYRANPMVRLRKFFRHNVLHRYDNVV